MGVMFPQDLAGWRRWHEQRRPLRAVRAVKDRVRPRPPAPGVVWVRGSDPRTLAILESDSITGRLAVLQPLASLDSAAVLAPTGVAVPGFRAGDLGLADVAPERILAIGHYLPLGAEAYAWSRRSGAEFWVVQHGLLTPWAPPLPAESRLLAWTAADAAYWTAGRDDVSTAVVGSQLLWQAAQQPTPEPSARPVWLGQLHGTEIDRRAMARVSVEFCREFDATYRPHQSERDRLSRWQHARWQRQGLRIDSAPAPLAEVGGPVVAAFSTGVLEAAARGSEAWVHFPEPPAWLPEFWERYAMARWGGAAPTPSPVTASGTEPATAVTDLLRAQTA